MFSTCWRHNPSLQWFSRRWCSRKRILVLFSFLMIRLVYPSALWSNYSYLNFFVLNILLNVMFANCNLRNKDHTFNFIISTNRIVDICLFDLTFLHKFLAYPHTGGEDSLVLDAVHGCDHISLVDQSSCNYVHMLNIFSKMIGAKN